MKWAFHGHAEVDSLMECNDLDRIYTIRRCLGYGLFWFLAASAFGSMKNVFFQPISPCWQHWWHSIAQSIASNESLNIRCAFKGFYWRQEPDSIDEKRPWGLAFSVDPCCTPTGSFMNPGIPKSGLDTTESPQQAVTIVHPFTSLAMLTMFMFRSLISSHCICSMLFYVCSMFKS